MYGDTSTENHCYAAVMPTQGRDKPYTKRYYRHTTNTLCSSQLDYTFKKCHAAVFFPLERSTLNKMQVELLNLWSYSQFCFFCLHPKDMAPFPPLYVHCCNTHNKRLFFSIRQFFSTAM